jgi:hypothetical protein
MILKQANRDRKSAQAKIENPSAKAFSRSSTENGVAVGPMEYCGNGRIVKYGHSSKR